MGIVKQLFRRDPTASFTVHQWLLLSAAFSCFLLLCRIAVTGSIAYLFLPWNLFLAFVPYWITEWMMRNVSVIENRVKLFLALAAWLLFVPNSFYIITDLFHLMHIGSAPKWFDLLMLFSFAWNGILLGILSIRRIELIITLNPGKSLSVFFIFPVMWLCAFGIYIGRYLRFNSWDIFTNPFLLTEEIMDLVFHPLQNGYAWGMTLVYSCFMTFLYFTLRKLGEVFSAAK